MTVVCSPKLLVSIYPVLNTTHHCNPEDHSVGHFFICFISGKNIETTKLLDLSWDYWFSGLCPLRTILKESSVLEIWSVSILRCKDGEPHEELGPSEIASLSHNPVIEIALSVRSYWVNASSCCHLRMETDPVVKILWSIRMLNDGQTKKFSNPDYKTPLSKPFRIDFLFV